MEELWPTVQNISNITYRRRVRNGTTRNFFRITCYLLVILMLYNFLSRKAYANPVEATEGGWSPRYFRIAPWAAPMRPARAFPSELTTFAARRCMMLGRGATRSLRRPTSQGSWLTMIGREGVAG